MFSHNVYIYIHYSGENELFVQEGFPMNSSGLPKNKSNRAPAHGKLSTRRNPYKGASEKLSDIFRNISYA